jgi:hypothetical protein
MELRDVISLFALCISGAAVAFAIFKGRYDQIVGVKPALVFVYTEIGWQIQNIGSGPALNIIIGKKEEGIASSNGQWSQPVRIPPLKKDAAFHLHWDPESNSYGLGATYEDMWGRRYTTTCGNDLNRIRRGRHLTVWLEKQIVAEWKLRKPLKP